MLSLTSCSMCMKFLIASNNRYIILARCHLGILGHKDTNDLWNISKFIIWIYCQNSEKEASLYSKTLICCICNFAAVRDTLPEKDSHLIIIREEWVQGCVKNELHKRALFDGCLCVAIKYILSSNIILSYLILSYFS